MDIKLYDSKGKLTEKKLLLADDGDVIFVTAKDSARMEEIRKVIKESLKESFREYKFLLINNRFIMYSQKHYKDDFGGTDKIAGIEIIYNHVDGRISDLNYFVTTPSSWEKERGMDVKINIRRFERQNTDEEINFPGVEELIRALEDKYHIKDCDEDSYRKNMYIITICRYTSCDRKYRRQLYDALKKLDNRTYFDARDNFEFTLSGERYYAALREKTVIYCRGNRYEDIDSFITALNNGCKVNTKDFGDMDDFFYDFLLKGRF